VRRGRIGGLTLVAVVWMLVSASVAGYTLAAGGPDGATTEALGPGDVTVTLDVRDSSFAPTRIAVRQHTTVTFEIANHDPIAHEFIVGGPEVHALHESGNHAQHGAVPGEVSIPPGEIGTTTYEFHTPGRVLFACHLPGHFAYGMKGIVVVRS
jgi:uncharacterized cupredoxin-like copper-binding protein